MEISNPLVKFAARYLPHYWICDVPPFHMEIYDALVDKSLERVAIEAGRGSAKSTIASIEYPLYEICEGSEPEIQTFSQSGGSTGLSTKWMFKIRKELEENQLLVYDYGIQRGEVWGQDHIQVKRGDGFVVDLYCRGKGAAARGSRGLVIIDDPQDSDDCSSETILARDENWLFSDILPILLKNQRLIFIGTPISPLSLLCKVKELPGWKVLSFPAIDPSGRSIWPEQWPLEVLDQRLAEMGLDRFNAEYMCRPMVSGNPVFRREWFKSYDPQSVQFQRLEREGFYTVTGFDGAESKADGADYSAVVTLSGTYGRNGDIYVREAFRDHLTTKQGAERLFVNFDNWKQHKTVVESRCKPPNVDAIIEEIHERERIYNTFLNLRQVKPDKDKVRRAHAVQSIVQQGRVYFDLNDPGQQALLSELTMFTGDQKFHDDLVDAFVYALTEIKERGGRELDKPSSKVVLPQGRTFKPHTGMTG